MNNIRIEKLTEVLERLNTEGPTEELRTEALDIVSSIDPIELSIAEQKLIEKGMDPSNLRHLCDIHMEILKGELDKVKSGIAPGHVIDTMIAEHDRILEFLTELEQINSGVQKLHSLDEDSGLIWKLTETAENILDAENHHRREENVLFPEMEKRGITGPTRIMRMEHDQLRARKRKLKETSLKAQDMDFKEFKAIVDETAKYIIFNLRDHIYKENHILYPTALSAIVGKEIWDDMKNRCGEIGYCSFTPERENKVSQFDAQIDVRVIPPRDKHPKIFDMFTSLKSGEVMELINDHDPRPLHYQMLAEYTDQFEWEYLEEGPEVWRVAITKK